MFLSHFLFLCLCASVFSSPLPPSVQGASPEEPLPEFLVAACLLTLNTAEHCQTTLPALLDSAKRILEQSSETRREREAAHRRSREHFGSSRHALELQPPSPPEQQQQQQHPAKPNSGVSSAEASAAAAEAEFPDFDYTAEEKLFGELCTAALLRVEQGVLARITPPLSQITQRNWHALQELGDQSAYVNEIH